MCSPLSRDVLLLSLDNSDHRFIRQRDDVLFVTFGLIEAQIPFMSIIADQTGQREFAQFPARVTLFYTLSSKC